MWRAATIPGWQASTLLTGCGVLQAPVPPLVVAEQAGLHAALDSAPGRAAAQSSMAALRDTVARELEPPAAQRALPTGPQVKHFDRVGESGRTARVTTRIKPDGYCTLAYQGRIEPPLVDGFDAAVHWLQQHPRRDTLVKLQSPGGDIAPGLPHGAGDSAPGVEHGRMAPACPDAGRLRMPPVCVDDPADPANQTLLAYYEQMVGDDAWLLLAKTLQVGCQHRPETLRQEEACMVELIDPAPYTTEIYERFR